MKSHSDDVAEEIMADLIFEPLSSDTLISDEVRSELMNRVGEGLGSGLRTMMLRQAILDIYLGLGSTVIRSESVVPRLQNSLGYQEFRIGYPIFFEVQPSLWSGSLEGALNSDLGFQFPVSRRDLYVVLQNHFPKSQFSDPAFGG